MADTNGAAPKRGVHFDPTINLGHVMTACASLTMVAGAFFLLQGQVTQLADNGKRTERVLDTKADKEVVGKGELELSRRIVEQQQSLAATTTGISEGFREVKGMLRDLDQKLDRKVDKPGR